MSTKQDKFQLNNISINVSCYFLAGNVMFNIFINIQKGKTFIFSQQSRTRFAKNNISNNALTNPVVNSIK